MKFLEWYFLKKEAKKLVIPYIVMDSLEGSTQLPWSKFDLQNYSTVLINRYLIHLCCICAVTNVMLCIEIAAILLGQVWCDTA